MTAVALTVVVFRDWWQIALAVVQVLAIGYSIGRGRTLKKMAEAFDTATRDHRALTKKLK